MSGSRLLRNSPPLPAIQQPTATQPFPALPDSPLSPPQLLYNPLSSISRLPEESSRVLTNSLRVRRSCTSVESEEKDKAIERVGHCDQHNYHPTFPTVAESGSFRHSHCGTTCGAIDEASRSSKAIDNRMIINFRNKNTVTARFCTSTTIYT